MALQPPPPYHVVTVPQVACQSGPIQHSQQQQRNLFQIKTTAILHFIGGTLLVLLGIVACILWAYWSFFATPIWSGIVIYGLTGCIGMCASTSKKRSMTGGYITMSIIAAAMSGALVVMYSVAAANEYGYYYYGWQCRPGQYWTYDCSKSGSARITFDSLIVVTAFFELIVSLLSGSYGCCFACTGCNRCCKSCCGNGCANCCASCCVGQCCIPQVSPHDTAVFATGATIATTSHGLQQSGGATLQSGLQTTDQPAAVYMYIVQQAPGPAYPPAGQTAPVQQLAYPPQAYVATSPGQQGAAPTQFVPAPIPNQQIENVHMVGATAPSMQAQSNYAGPSMVQVPVVQPQPPPQATNFPHSTVSEK